MKSGEPRRGLAVRSWSGLHRGRDLSRPYNGVAEHDVAWLLAARGGSGGGVRVDVIFGVGDLR